MSDPIFEVRNSFYLGNFQACINEAQKSKFDNKEKHLFMYRSYIATKKYGVVSNEVDGSRGKEYKAILQLSQYMSGDERTKQSIVEQIEKLEDTQEPDEYVHLIVAAQIYFLENRFEDAIRILHGVDQLECTALTIQALLKLDRVDLARKELKKMQEKDEDATISQLANAWVILATGTGGDKLEEAYYIFHDLATKYGTTPLLLNGQAASLIARGKYDEAEPLLQEALEKDSNNAEALINLIALSHFTGKGPDVAARFLNQLKDGNHRHPFVTDFANKEKELDQLILRTNPIN